VNRAVRRGEEFVAEAPKKKGRIPRDQRSWIKASTMYVKEKKECGIRRSAGMPGREKESQKVWPEGRDVQEGNGVDKEAVENKLQWAPEPNRLQKEGQKTESNKRRGGKERDQANQKVDSRKKEAEAAE